MEGLAERIVIEDFGRGGRGEEEGEEGRERGAELFERLGARDERVGEVGSLCSLELEGVARGRSDRNERI